MTSPRSRYRDLQNKHPQKHSELLEQCVAYLNNAKKNGLKIWWFKVHGSNWQKPGIPDILMCCNGRFVGLEMKADGDYASTVQQGVIAQIHQAQGRCYIIRDAMELENVLKENYFK